METIWHIVLKIMEIQDTLIIGNNKDWITVEFIKKY